MNKEKILIVGCQKTMDTICVGCSRCMIAFNRRDGSFSVYDSEAELIGILGCGDCPGQGIVMRLSQLNLWNQKLDVQPTRVHVAPCLLQHCPNTDTLLAKINAKAGIPVVEGAHPYVPQEIFR